MEGRGPAQLIYDFGDGSREQVELLGGKGANISEMIRVLGADRVPPGFTISTRACLTYLRDRAWPAGLDEELERALDRLEATSGRALGDSGDPLLVSVRSGAPVSMPGMLDTVLNLGLNDDSVTGLARRTGNPRFAWDSYRRFCQMFGNVVRGIPGAEYERLIGDAKRARGVSLDVDLDADDLRALTRASQDLFRTHTGASFPQDPRRQLRAAVEAVFESWNAPRAIDFRRLNAISHDLGTAVNVQRMVFGNTGSRSGSGVAFSRDAITGEARASGDFLANAQGEDVVSGVRNTSDLEQLSRAFPDAHAELVEILRTLERHFGDMQDVEFTIEDGRLYILQTRSAKRPAQAAIRFACDAVAEGLLEPDAALLTVDPHTLDTLLHPRFDPRATFEVIARGVAASPGAASGRIAFSADEAIAAAARGEEVILVRRFTEADDVAGFHAARGILTAEGGRASHAALVARAMGRPAVTGVAELRVDGDGGRLDVAGRSLGREDTLSIDGSSGIVTLDEVPLVQPEVGPELEQVLAWSDEFRRLAVRANADTPADAARARELGASGVGLCRTEHMFFGADRDHLVREMFLAAERWRGSSSSPDRADEEVSRARAAFDAAVERLGRLQRDDFEQILRRIAPDPVTVRLLDPPLHEFLPVSHFERQLEQVREQPAVEDDVVEEALEQLRLARALDEVNPMLGTRGARLGVLYPMIYEMQVTAAIEAAAAVAEDGTEAELELMLPLIGWGDELRALRELVDRAARRAIERGGREVRYCVGTMIELPRACLVAGRLAEFADFFSFGTNDLTQMTGGISRDDAEASFLDAYIEAGIIERSPFESLDTEGVGRLISLAAEDARAAAPSLRLGVCGEHGGDPRSIAFFEQVGLDYVSCSPERVAVARLAAAQAAIRAGG